MVRFGFHVLQFHPNRKITENPPTVAANILRKKILVHPLGLRRNCIVATKWTMPSGQFRSILPVRVANHSTEFISPYRLVELAV